jgi:hypothetical protein
MFGAAHRAHQIPLYAWTPLSPLGSAAAPALTCRRGQGRLPLSASASGPRRTAGRQRPQQALWGRCPRLAGRPEDSQDAGALPRPPGPVSVAHLRDALGSIAPGVCGLSGVPTRNRQDFRPRSRRRADQLRCDRIALRGGSAPRGGSDAGRGSQRPSPTGVMWGTNARGSRAGAGDQRGETTREHGSVHLVDQTAARGAGTSGGSREARPESRWALCGTPTASQKPVKSCSNRQSINRLWASIWAASGAPGDPLYN